MKFSPLMTKPVLLIQLTMKDPRGVERGKCTKCSCTAYELEANATRATCSYCECAAPAHEEITNLDESGSNSTLSLSSSNSSLGSPIIIETASGSNFLEVLLDSSTSNEPTSEDIEKEFPLRLPTKVSNALMSRKVEANHKSVIVQKVVDNLYGKNLASNKCLEKAARKMAQRWSPLKVDGDPKHLGLYEKCRRRRDRLNESAKKRSKEAATSSDEPGDQTPESVKQEMKGDWSLGKRDVSIYRSKMAVCRELRKDSSKKLPGLQLLREFPALNLPDILLGEFEFEMKLTRDQMEANWTKSALQIMTYMREKNICVQSGTLDEKTRVILEYFHKIPLWYKKSFDDNRAAKVMEVFEVTTPTAEMTPRAKDPPRLLAAGREENCSLHCFLDTEPIFCVEDSVQGLLLLLATYYVLGIKFPPHTRLQLIVLCCATVGASAANLNSDIAKNNKLLDLLKVLKLK
ncbi:uncharacterized protein LOC117643698 isoform X3 [Thrips palmi]|uniref:Uncharacterized protein LOC117643698 isoform X3 n=1 Tax=Thrips palmi TaxID=161013 RepID=A0A6P8ZLD0_THRPL|nr:uncharacterized protein LOC117643698 isoform X3 [Thrips palmi]